MNVFTAQQMCSSPRMLEVQFTSPEWTMLVFVCVVVFFFTGKRLLLDVRGWLS